MSAIAYITDSKMLQLHRLNNHKTINFWRVSTNINFTDFKENDLVFFLSKDKEHKKKNEKGIVGFGRLNKFEVASAKTMWNKYGILNGYPTVNEFKEAIIKVSKNKELPKRISSFELCNVCFFQPIYLSECGLNISNKVESYIYLKEKETVIKLLQLARQSRDLWSSLNNNYESIEKEEVLYRLFSIHKEIKDISLDQKTKNKAGKIMRKYVNDNPEYRMVRNSDCEAYRINDNKIEILFYNDKNSDIKAIIGQACIYKETMFKQLPEYLLSFRCLNQEYEPEIIRKL